MSELYIQFCKKLYDYFFSNTGYGPLIFAVDEHIANSCAKSRKKFSAICLYLGKFDKWEHFFCEKGNIPMYLGLLAIQVYAATLLEKDEKYSETDYYQRLANVLGIDKDNVSCLWGRVDNDESIQESLWSKFKQFAENKGRQLLIPDHKNRKGRFIQYPLSQVGLNREDLKYLSKIFKDAQLLSGTDISKDKLDSIIRTHKQIPKRLKNKYDDDKKCNMLKEQAFNFFCEWDGKEYEIVSGSKKFRTQTNYIIEYRNGKYLLRKVVGDNSEKISWQELSNLSHKISSNEIAVAYFKETDDWRFVRYLDRSDSRFMIVLNKCYADSWLYKKIIDLLSKKPYEFNGFQMLIFDSGRQNLLENILGEEEFDVVSSFELIGGAKLGYSSWLYGAGPLLIRDGTQKEIRLNGKVLQHGDLVDLEIGKYQLDDGQRCKNFEIKNYENKKPPKEVFWKISPQKLSQVDGDSSWNLQGLYFKSEAALVREWLELFSGKQKNKNHLDYVNALRRGYGS